MIDVGLKMDPDKAEKRKGAYQCHECDDEFQTNKKLLIHKATKHSATDKGPIINHQRDSFNIKSKYQTAKENMTIRYQSFILIALFESLVNLRVSIEKYKYISMSFAQ